MKYQKIQTPLVDALHDQPRSRKLHAPIKGALRIMDPTILGELPEQAETTKRTAFTALDRLAKTFGTQDSKGVWVELTGDKDAHPMAFLRPFGDNPERQHITFWAGGNNLSVIEAEDSTSEEPSFLLDYEEPEGRWVPSTEERAAREAGQLKQQVDFDNLPLGQRLNTLEVLNTLATAMTADEGVQAYAPITRAS